MSSDPASLFPPPGRVHLGVDVGGTKMLVVSYADSGRSLFSFPTGPHCGPGAIAANLISVLSRFRGTHEIVLGLAVPGLIGHDGTIVECDVLPALKGWNPCRQSPQLGLRSLLNDGEAALAAIAREAAPDATLAAVGSGTALVAAFQIAGVRLRTKRPYSGELGYLPFGAQGPLDAHASGAALLSKLQLTADQLTARLQQQDPAAVDAVRQAGAAFGTGLAALVNLFHPERIGLYGGTLDYPGYLDTALDTARRLSHPALGPLCRIEVVLDPQTVVANGALLEALRP